MDNRRLNGLTHVIYEASMDPTLWPAVMEDIATAFSVRGCTLTPLARPAQVLASSGMEAAGADYAADWWRHDPMNRPAFLDCRGLTTDWILLPEERRRRDPFYQEFKRHHGLGHFVTYVAELEPGDLFSFGCHLPFDRAAVPDATSLSQFETVGRHMIRAVTLSGRLFAASQGERGLAAVLSTLQHGVALLDGRGEVRDANAAFTDLARRGLSIQRRRLRTARMRDQLPLDRLIGQALGLVSGGPEMVTVAVPEGGASLLVSAMPLPSSERVHATLPAELRVLVLVVSPTAPATDAAATLRYLGLTAAEARVAALTGSGSSAPEIAEKLGTSLHTVRTQIKVAMGKLGFTRQSELVSLVSRLSVLNEGG